LRVDQTFLNKDFITLLFKERRGIVVKENLKTYEQPEIEVVEFVSEDVMDESVQHDDMTDLL